VEGAALIIDRRAVAEAVQARLPDRSHPLVGRELRDVRGGRVVESLAGVRVAAHGREDVVEALGEGDRLAIALLPQADGEDASQAGAACGGDGLLRPLLTKP
jgi:hypothetical protein